MSGDIFFHTILLFVIQVSLSDTQKESLQEFVHSYIQLLLAFSLHDLVDLQVTPKKQALTHSQRVAC